MTDIVITDSLVLTDSESHLLANRVTDTAAVSDSVNVGGSHYTIIVSDGAAVADSYSATRKVTASVSDGAASSDTEADERGLRLSQSAAASDAVTLITHATLPVSETANVTDSVGSPTITASYADTAEASDSVVVRRAVAVSDGAVAADSVVVQRTSTASVSDGARARETTGTPAVSEADEAAAIADSAIGTRIVESTEADTAAASDSAAGSYGRKEISVSDTAAVSDSQATVLHATYAAEDSADVTERVRSNVDGYGNFWTNRIGAAALWEGLPFTCLLQDSDSGLVYGAGDYGLYVMGADKDDGAAVISRVTYDLLDYGSPQRKRWVGVYVLGSADGAYKVNVISNKGTFRYTTHPTKERAVVQHRVTPGRGLDSVKYRIDVQQVKPHSTEQIIAELENIARRI